MCMIIRGSLIGERNFFIIEHLIIQVIIRSIYLYEPKEYRVNPY